MICTLLATALTLTQRALEARREGACLITDEHFTTSALVQV